MEYLIEPIMSGTPNAKSTCTCFLGSNNECDHDCIVHDICVYKCALDCGLLVCGRGVARRITQ